MQSQVVTLSKEATEEQKNENSSSESDSSDSEKTLDEIIEVYTK